MNRKRFRSNSIIAFLACTILLLSFVAAQTLSSQQKKTHSSASPASAPSPPPQNPPTVPPPPPQRDLSLYDQAGPFALSRELAPTARRAVLSQIRSFLWDHWQQRRRGYLTMSTPDAIGRSIASRFYVEPAENGNWCIRLETAGKVETFRVVEQVEVPEDGPPILNAAPGQRGRGSGSTGLHLKESAGAKAGMVL